MSAAIAAAAVVAGASIYSSNQQKKTANNASKKQLKGDAAALAEEQRQFDEIRRTLAPYIQGGQEATDAERAFLGLLGPEQEQQFISSVENGQQFKTGVKQGETAILQNASATGGLRGGNVQRSLADFRPNLLNQVIAQRFAGLESLAGRGQASAAGQAAAGQNNANAIAGILQDQGAAQAGAAIARGNAAASLSNGLGQAAGTLAGYFSNRPTSTVKPPPAYVPSTGYNGPVVPPQYDDPNQQG